LTTLRGPDVGLDASGAFAGGHVRHRNIDPERRTALVLAAVAAPPAIVAAIIGVLAVGAVLGVVLLVVVALAVAAAVWIRSGRRAGDLGGIPADPMRHARLVNLVDGLCVSAGVRPPALRVLDAPGCNLAVIGRDAGHAALVVTGVTRVELEGALATGIVELRRGDAGPATAAVAAGSFTVRLAVDPRRDRIVDEAAAALTRYPPGLAAAYRKMARHGTVVPGAASRTAHLWLADPREPGEPSAYRLTLQERIGALVEL
jgi:hypothetical protein